MARAWLGLGANIGDPPAQVREAVLRLDAHPGIDVVAQSTMLITKPWGKTDQPDFSNMVVEIETHLGPHELLDACLGVELEMGRVRDIRWGRLPVSTGRPTVDRWCRPRRSIRTGSRSRRP